MSNPNGDGNFPGNAPVELRVRVLGQYVKDLSFENPAGLLIPNARPQIDLGVDMQARRLDPEKYEVEMKLRVSAKADEKPVFLLELVYAGQFLIQNAPEEILQQFLLIEAPHILFPFARRIVADVVRDGGMPPVMIEPIDFASLYRARQAEMQQAQTGEVSVA